VQRFEVDPTPSWPRPIRYLSSPYLGRRKGHGGGGYLREGPPYIQEGVTGVTIFRRYFIARGRGGRLA